MRAYDLIAKKRDGLALSADEIRWLVAAFCSGEVSDAQMAAFLMAVYLRDMTPEETTALTLAMAESGKRLDLALSGATLVDKHSTGGVGDKTTLVVVPLVAECGVPVAKMSGRSLGHAGGTVDKLESIPGFRTELSIDELLEQVRRVGAAMVGQSADLAPADKRIYALRDLTATVESVPLIAASIMSKKIATGASAFVLDVKVGRGAYMKTLTGALRLAETLVKIAENAGKRAVARVTAMDQPLGRAVGNAVEVREAVLALRGEGPPDLEELAVALAAEMLYLSGSEPDVERAAERAAAILRSGRALDRFKAIVEAQGGDPRYIEACAAGGPAPGCKVVPVQAERKGWVAGIDGAEVGLAAMALGAGRTRAGEAIDHHVGVLLHKKVGDEVRPGEPVAEVIARDPESGGRAAQRVLAAYTFTESPVQAPPLLLGRFEAGSRPRTA